jgi:LysM repeat protein
VRTLVLLAAPALLMVGAAGAALVVPDRAEGIADPPARRAEDAPGAAVDPPCAEPGLRYAHTLARGESLSAVAARAGVTPERLAALNCLADPDRVLPGTELILRSPVAGRAGRAGCELVPRPGPDEVRLEIFKAERCLELRVRGVLFRRYRAGLGPEPLGAKSVEGDGRTPEGEFYVCQKLPDGRFGPSLGLSYPGPADAERGLRDGLITAGQHREILRSAAGRRRPPWNTPLGGAICIHGRGSAEDWTAGCVALDDADAGEVYALVPMGAPVRLAARR